MSLKGCLLQNFTTPKKRVHFFKRKNGFSNFSTCLCQTGEMKKLFFFHFIIFKIFFSSRRVYAGMVSRTRNLLHRRRNEVWRFWISIKSKKVWLVKCHLVCKMNRTTFIKNWASAIKENLHNLGFPNSKRTYIDTIYSFEIFLGIFKLTWKW